MTEMGDAFRHMCHEKRRRGSVVGLEATAPEKHIIAFLQDTLVDGSQGIIAATKGKELPSCKTTNSGGQTSNVPYQPPKLKT